MLRSTLLGPKTALHALLPMGLRAPGAQEWDFQVGRGPGALDRLGPLLTPGVRSSEKLGLRGWECWGLLLHGKAPGEGPGGVSLWGECQHHAPDPGQWGVWPGPLSWVWAWRGALCPEITLLGSFLWS